MSSAPFRSEEARARYLELYDARAGTWPIAAACRSVETSFGATFVRSSGPADASPVVLLPGIGSTSLMWAPNVEALARQHRVHAVDNIYDYGRSVFSRPIRDAEDFGLWLDELLQALSPERPVHLVGVSYGAWIAARYALRSPSRIDRLVLIAPAGTIQPLSFGFLCRAALCVLPLRYFTRRLLYWLAKNTRARGEEGEEIVERAVDEGFLAARCFAPKRMVPPDLLSDEELRRLPASTVFLFGEHENVFSTSDAIARLREARPAADARVIAGAGHDLTIAQAEVVNRVLLDLLGPSRQ